MVPAIEARSLGIVPVFSQNCTGSATCCKAAKTSFCSRLLCVLMSNTHKFGRSDVIAIVSAVIAIVSVVVAGFSAFYTYEQLQISKDALDLAKNESLSHPWYSGIIQVADFPYATIYFTNFTLNIEGQFVPTIVVQAKADSSIVANATFTMRLIGLYGTNGYSYVIDNFQAIKIALNHSSTLQVVVIMPIPRGITNDPRPRVTLALEAVLFRS